MLRCGLLGTDTVGERWASRGQLRLRGLSIPFSCSPPISKCLQILTGRVPLPALHSPHDGELSASQSSIKVPRKERSGESEGRVVAQLGFQLRAARADLGTQGLLPCCQERISAISDSSKGFAEDFSLISQSFQQASSLPTLPPARAENTHTHMHTRTHTHTLGVPVWLREGEKSGSVSQRRLHGISLPSPANAQCRGPGLWSDGQGLPQLCPSLPERPRKACLSWGPPWASLSR